MGNDERAGACSGSFAALVRATRSLCQAAQTRQFEVLKVRLLTPCKSPPASHTRIELPSPGVPQVRMLRSYPQDLRGAIGSGTMTLLLAPPGHGKSSLLKVRRPSHTGSLSLYLATSTLSRPTPFAAGARWPNPSWQAVGRDPLQRLKRAAAVPRGRESEAPGALRGPDRHSRAFPHREGDCQLRIRQQHGA